MYAIKFALTNPPVVKYELWIRVIQAGLFIFTH